MAAAAGMKLNAVEQAFLDESRSRVEEGISSRRFFASWLRPSSSELQEERPRREYQILQQADQLREQAARLHELALFEQKSETVGGVFISYSHRDGDVVDALARRFEEERINYWRDEKDLLIGDVLDKSISKGIQESRLFLIVLTPTSIASRWVARELDEAAHEASEGNKIVLPVVAKGLLAEQIPARLRRQVYVDLSKNFNDWVYETFEVDSAPSQGAGVTGKHLLYYATRHFEGAGRPAVAGEEARAGWPGGAGVVGPAAV